MQGSQPQQASTQEDFLQRLISLSRQSQQQQQLQQQQQQQQQMGNQMQTSSLGGAPLSPLGGSLTPGVGVLGGLGGILQNKGVSEPNPPMSLQTGGDAIEDGGQQQDN
eukprot:TRINITY_DN8644_c0_g1_i10.p4 TRINITY_DN8644_c0_g1~~TRINITY_DN8644_c0_g1_i10.p4  ORF type:complete len:108 (-),score=24.47 TRINITY_DN8644_c0_g1_i10:675-998(-)